MPFAQRVEILESCRFVDKVIREDSWEQKRDDIIREGADIFAMGDDWAGKFDDLSDIAKVVYLPRTQDVSTTEIRQIVNSMYQERLQEVRGVIEHLSAMVAKI